VLAVATSASLALARALPTRAGGGAVSIRTWVGAVRPSATPARAGRSVATRTIRGLRGLTEKQLASDWVSLTQPDLPAAPARLR
jgi:hypothetical protein